MDKDLLVIGLGVGVFLVLVAVAAAYQRYRKFMRRVEKEAQEAADALVKDAQQKAEAILRNAQERLDRLKQTDKEMVDKLRESRELLENISDRANAYASDIEIITENDLRSSAEYQKDRKEVEKVLKTLAKNAIVGAVGKAADVNIDKFVAISAKADMAGALLVTTVEMLCAKTNHSNGRQSVEKLTESIVAVEALVKILDSRAQIHDEFKGTLLKRLDVEIKFKVAKQLALEQQRELREQEREEQRVRKEAQKAQEKAERDEQIKQNAIEELQARMAQESEAERATHALQLEKLQKELEEAKAAAERARSRAQETRQGHVYIISNIGSFGSNMLKIGMTRRLDPLDRVRELGDASVPFNFDVHALIECDDAPALENQLHKRFETKRVNKMNIRKEFFSVNLDDIENALIDMKIEVLLNKIPSADEYYQSVRVAELGR